MGDVDKRGSCVCLGARGIWELYILLNFAVKLQLLPKKLLLLLLFKPDRHDTNECISRSYKEVNNAFLIPME